MPIKLKGSIEWRVQAGRIISGGDASVMQRLRETPCKIGLVMFYYWVMGRDAFGLVPFSAAL